MLHPKFDSHDFLEQLPMANDAIDLSKLIKLPGGGTHDIYKLTENPSFLLKIVRNSVGIDVSVLESSLADLTSKYAELYKVFGDERCLLETRCIKKIKQAGAVEEQNAIISLVAFEKCFQSKDRFGFNAETVEVKEPKLKSNSSRYHRMNRALLGTQDSFLSSDVEDFLFFYKSFRSIFDLLDNEPSLVEAMKEFLYKFKKYYNKTDQLLDFTGRDNVLFYKHESGIWQYKVGSVIKTETGIKAIRLIHEIDSNPSVVNDSFQNWTHIYFVPSWVRIVNATAAKLGMSRVIDNIIVSQKDSENLSRMYEKLKLNERAVNCADEQDFESAQQFFEQYQCEEKVHDTWTRYMLGTIFWRFVQNNETLRPQQEVMLFLNLLVDPKNEYPDEVRVELHSAIVGLQAQLEGYGPIEHDTALKIDIMFDKMGFSDKRRRGCLEEMLNNVVKELEATMISTPELRHEGAMVHKLITPMREAAKLSKQPTAESSISQDSDLSIATAPPGKLKFQ